MNDLQYSPTYCMTIQDLISSQFLPDTSFPQPRNPQTDSVVSQFAIANSIRHPAAAEAPPTSKTLSPMEVDQ